MTKKLSWINKINWRWPEGGKKRLKPWYELLYCAPFTLLIFIGISFIWLGFLGGSWNIKKANRIVKDIL